MCFCVWSTWSCKNLALHRAKHTSSIAAEQASGHTPSINLPCPSIQSSSFTVAHSWSFQTAQWMKPSCTQIQATIRMLLCLVMCRAPVTLCACQCAMLLLVFWEDLCWDHMFESWASLHRDLSMLFGLTGWACAGLLLSKFSYRRGALHRLGVTNSTGHDSNLAVALFYKYSWLSLLNDYLLQQLLCKLACKLMLGCLQNFDSWCSTQFGGNMHVIKKHGVVSIQVAMS